MGKLDWTPRKMGSLWAVRVFRSLATWFLLFGIVFMIETGKNGDKTGLDDPVYLVPLFILMAAVVMYGTSWFALYVVKTQSTENIAPQELDRVATMIKLVVDIVVAIALVVAYHFIKPVLGVDISLSFAVSYLFWLCINIVTWLLSGIVKITPVKGVYTGKVVAYRSVKASVVGAHIGLLLLAWFIFWYMSR